MSVDHHSSRVNEVVQRLIGALDRANRSRGDVTLVAVSKGISVESILAVGAELEARAVPVVIGESFTQEFKSKKPLLPVGWSAHLIGGLQRNKAKDALRLFDVIESVDSLELATALDKEAAKRGERKDVLLQVNISSDEHKHGVSPAQTAALAVALGAQCSHLCLRGLMTVTRYYEQPEHVRPDYRAMKELALQLEQSKECASLWRERRIEISMGMSSDFEIAIEEGATIVRIGTALFGEREKAQVTVSQGGVR